MLEDLLSPLGYDLPDVDVAAHGFIGPRLVACRRLQAACDNPDLDDAALLLAVQEYLTAVSPRSEGPDQLQAAANELAADLRSEMSIAWVAKRAGYSAVHFRRIFAERYGCSPAAWRDQARMRRAEMLLQDDALSVNAIAEQLGYANPFAFSSL